jgi:hypothetical protein
LGKNEKNLPVFHLWLVHSGLGAKVTRSEKSTRERRRNNAMKITMKTNP